MRSAIWLTLSLCTAVWLGALACAEERETPDVSAANVSQEAREAWQAARDYGFAKRDEYSDALEDYLDELENRIDALQARADRETSDQLAALRRERDRVKGELEELGSATAATWEEAKASIERSLDELERSLERTQRRVG